MQRKKVYGQSRTEICPLCGQTGIIKNAQGIPVCQDHKEFTIELKCACGSWLDAKESKWGVFFTCINCGAISYHKAMVMNGLD